MIRFLSRGWWLLVPAVVAFAYRYVSRNGLIGDANLLIIENRYIADLAYLWDNLLHDYFWSSSGSFIPYWRPVTKGSWVLEYQFFQTWSGGYALVSLGWHLLAVVAVEFLALCVGLSRRWALLAGLLFGLSAIAIEPVSLVMARSDVVCVCATLWAVATWHRWAQTRRLRWVFPHLLAVILALGSKEAGVVIAPVVTLWTLLRGWEAGANRSKGAGLLRELALVAPSWALSAAYLAARWLVLRSDGGAHASASGVAGPLQVFASLTLYLQNLIPFRLSSTIRNLPHAEASSVGFLLMAALTAFVAMALLAWLVHRRNADALALAAWIPLALAPVLLVGEMAVPGIAGKYALSDRWLYHTLGAASLLAALSFANLPWPRVQQGILLAAVGWGAAVVVLNESVRAEYVSEFSLLRTEDRGTYFATPPEFRTPEDECRFLDRQFVRAVAGNDLETALAKVDLALERCPDATAVRTLNRFSTLVWLRRFDQARPLAEALLKSPPVDPRDHAKLTYLASVAFIETGAPELAERWLPVSQQLGYHSCDIEKQLARVAIARLQPDRASQHLETAYACEASRNPALLLDAARWSIYSGQPKRASKLLARIRADHASAATVERQVAQLEAQIERMGRSQ